MNPRGMTLIELLAASVISFAIILALGHIDVTRVRMSQGVNARAAGSTESSLALASIVKDLERADRLVMLNAACQNVGGVSGSCVQIRIPAIGLPTSTNNPPNCTNCRTASAGSCCLDIERNYRWVEYRLDAANRVVQFYDDVRLPSGNPNCGGRPDQVFMNIANLTVSYVDESKPVAPPDVGGGALGGNEPLPPDALGNYPDNNVVRVDVDWVNPLDPAAPYRVTSEVVLRATPYTNVANGLDVTNASPPPVAPCT